MLSGGNRGSRFRTKNNKSIEICSVPIITLHTYLDCIPRSYAHIYRSGNASPDGIRAVQSTPLLSRSGALIGVLSTHWRTPHELTVGREYALDVIARRAADFMERSQATWADFGRHHLDRHDPAPRNREAFISAKLCYKRH